MKRAAPSEEPVDLSSGESSGSDSEHVGGKEKSGNTSKAAAATEDTKKAAPCEQPQDVSSDDDLSLDSDDEAGKGKSWMAFGLPNSSKAASAAEVTKLHLERRESLVRLKQGARCPFAVSDRLHPKYCLEDESPYIQEGKHNWGPIQVLLKEQRCFEDWDHSEGENPGISEMDNLSLGCSDVVTHGCSDVYGSHDSGPELRDDGALHNRVPSNALEDLGIEEPITTAPTPARSEECFEKEGNVNC